GVAYNSKLDLERELQNARVGIDRGDPPERRASDPVVRIRELRPVEKIEELRTEDEARRLLEAEWEGARDRQIHVLEVRPAQRVATERSVGPGRRLGDGGGVEVGRAPVAAAPPIPQVQARDLIGARGAGARGAVAGARDAERPPRLQGRDAAELPAAE